jgi:anhydro-N-acetylmuramic acid kinase
MTDLRETLWNKESRLVVGLMTGTSADGVDAVLAQIDGTGASTKAQVLAHLSSDIPAELRADLFTLFMPDALVEDLCSANFALGEVLANAALAVIEEAGMTPDEVDLIGSHGQTVRHLPETAVPSTLQIGEPAVIAQRTGITTVADFRPADIAVGGQGAPLVPLVDYLLFRDDEVGRLMLNIGGIANVTVLPAEATPEAILAFDLGPGNMLVDGAVAHLTGGAERFDDGGRRAARGQADESWVARLIEHEFIRRIPPKSTGREEFGTEYLAEVLTRMELTADDIIATLTTFTARAIGEGIRSFVVETYGEGALSEVWVSGGGVHNLHLMGLLQQELPGMAVAPIDDLGLGVSAAAKEALCFAVLANQTIAGRGGNLPGATGAERPVVLGKIVLGNRF